jgi:amino acid adenylation domain-containing protein
MTRDTSAIEHRVSADKQVPKSIQDRFERFAHATPDATALVCGTELVTYGALNRRANQVAHHLRGLQMAPGSLVLLQLPRGIASVIAILGILKAGHGYVPLEDCCSAERFGLVLRDTAATAILTESGKVGEFPPGDGVHRICLDAIADQLAALPDGNVGSSTSPSDVAYCMYSSGSTGMPKGILTPHAGVLRLVCEPHYVSLGPGEVLLHAAPLAFDASTFELWGALLNGGTVAILERGSVTPDAVAEAIARHRVTTAWLTAPLFHRIGQAEFERMGGLRQLLAGGDVLRPDAVARTLAALPNCRVINGYGPTETTTFAICGALIQSTDGAAVPLGRPINATQVHILDERLLPVEPGTMGEICIAGEGLALGYLNRPDLTAEKFVPSPFGVPGSRMYRSGDLGRQAEDGSIEFGGRLDHQVKINGFRVELGEIEAAVALQPDVAECVVIAHEYAPGEKRLVCYVTAKRGLRPTVDGLRAGLAGKLPMYMIPAAWVFVDAMPQSPNGKTDRRALPPPASVRAWLGTEYVKPVSGLEQRIAEIWAAVLRMDRVGRFDQFASLGGSSIQAIDVSFRVARELFGGERVPAPLGNTSLAAYAGACAALPARPRQSTPGLDNEVELSWASQAQQQVWFLEQLGEGWRAYRFHARFNLSGPLDVPALHAAINALVERHEILRTSFVPHNGELVRHVSANLTVPLPMVDLSTLEPAKCDAALQQSIEAELAHRFDVSRAPLARWLLVRLGEQAHVLLQSEHHYLHDGQSFRILVRDLSALYGAAREGKHADLPHIEAHYGAYCAEERRWLQTAEFREHLSAWRETLAPFGSDIALFGNRKRPQERRSIGAQARRPVSPDTVRLLDRTAASLGVSRFVIMISAFSMLCARHSNQQRFLMGSALANRTAAKYQWATGMFVNMLPIPFHCAPDLPFAEFVRATAATVDFTLSHSRVPLGEIVKALNLSASLMGDSPFNIGFSFHDSLEAEPHFGGLDVEIDEAIAIGSAKFDLDVVVIAGNQSKRQDQGLELLFEYNTDCFDAAAIERMLDHYGELLRDIGAHPQQRLRDFSILTPQERRLLLETFVDTSEDFDLDLCIHEAFEQQVRTRPNAVAVVAGARRITYDELNRRANQLAHHLRSCGVGPEVAVAVCVERSIELIVALIGVLKAGGVYVPLDPRVPAERRDSVLADTNAPVLLNTVATSATGASSTARTICLDANLQEIEQQTDQTPVNLSRPGNLAYCIFTSGSTGRPKGVGVSIRSLMNHARSHTVACRLNPSDRVLQICASGFDASLEEIVPTLLCGAMLVMAPPGLNAPDEEFLAWVASERLTVLDLPTAFWAALVTHADAASAFPQTVRTLVVGGEAAKWEHVELTQRLNQNPDFTLFNTYGPTEATVIATRGQVKPRQKTSSGAGVPLGKSISNVQVYVLDEHLEPVPIGVPGEICIGGTGVARGYVNRPDLTAEKFVPDPYGVPGQRMYRTGDLASYLPDGNIEFHGRVDHQVKVRGFRVEPGEIEAALVRLPGVREAAVIARAVGPAELQLVGYLVTDNGAALDVDGLRTDLGRCLPEYMVPASWVFLERMPLNRNGKLDRAQLPEPAAQIDSRSPELSEDDAPEELTEINDILRTLMPSVSIGPDDDLLGKGMHSVLLLRLVMACKARLKAQLKVRDVYRLATPRALARHVREAGVAIE